VVVVSRDAINHYSPVIVVCPLTDASHITKLYPSDVQVIAPEDGLTKGFGDPYRASAGHRREPSAEALERA